MAFDSGITHFDAARSYGYGLAEVGLRPFLKRNRSRVTIATKAGIEPRLHPIAARTLGPLARQLRASQVANPKTTRAIAGSALGHIPLDSRTLQSSFDFSLRKLGVNDVDIFFLHEPTGLQITTEVIHWLDRIRGSGKAKRVGIATTQPAEAVYAELPSWLLYQISFQHMRQYDDLGLSVFGVHSIFAGSHDGQTGSNHLGDAARKGVMCLASMYSEQHLVSNCKSVSPDV